MVFVDREEVAALSEPAEEELVPVPLLVVVPLEAVPPLLLGVALDPLPVQLWLVCSC